MSEYKMNIKGKIVLEDYSSVYDYMSIIGENDNLTIEIDGDDDENKEIICNMLKNKKFTVSLNETCDGKRRYIKAFKM
ncbi:hypothetical protein ACFHWD_19260 [Clostridium sp. MT-14]|jgi:hypothetical protein|uniref:Uncharacterized protein n=1 Tax=Clostridium aromativorans TaxID=2836848 RepID=A0ABS8N9T8_9CLOT|nr:MULTISPECIES: hypothetical protein [Clostridium]KAA8670342.1 hypothetical protein F3O63_12520 [Clostridium sp. HV4-5-A1G]MCC9296586.1 hypothetical protein [Clostridium aromativorans]CAB1261459.1 conserved hypothetical protein [Clostridiaceae bacterium BL-3]